MVTRRHTHDEREGGLSPPNQVRKTPRKSFIETLSVCKMRESRSSFKRTLAKMQKFFDLLSALKFDEEGLGST